MTAKPHASSNPMRRHCTATTRGGKPCKGQPIEGGTVCRMHGGSAPQVLAKARRRILEAADSVAAELVRLAMSAESEPARVAAARDLLDRAGLDVAQKTELTGRDGAPIEVRSKLDLSKLTVEDLRTLDAITSRATRSE